jgi:PAS domain S-box-containing protein
MTTTKIPIHDLLLSHDEATDALSAIRAGRVDAVVISGTDGDQVVTFRDPDHSIRALVEAMGEGAALATLDGTISYHNPRFAELAGQPGVELRGRIIGELFDGETAASIGGLLERARGGRARIEVASTLADRVLWLQLTASLAHVADVPVVCVVATDVSEQHAQEKLYRNALAGMEARERLISVAGHELRNPMQVIELQTEAMLEQLRATPSVTPTVAQLEVMQRHVTSMSRLVGNLLDLGVVSSNQLDLVIEDVDLGDLVKMAVDECEDLTRSKSPVSLDIQSATGKWDRVRLGQVAVNLISNAAKYGLSKPIRIAVDGDDTTAHLVVEDNGIGVAANEIERLFRPFDRIGAVKAATGLGLGLYITAQIVKAHGGSIAVESTPGSGTRFVVTLPRNR